MYALASVILPVCCGATLATIECIQHEEEREKRRIEHQKYEIQEVRSTVIMQRIRVERNEERRENS